ncbi:MAG: phage terminase small subunit P27 family [Chloroflexota bacterium]
MSKRGPMPTPTSQKLLAGNPGKRPLNLDQPQPRRGLLRCPSWLRDEAKREWRRVAPELGRLGLLTELDRSLLASYCQTLARWRQCEEILAVHGRTYWAASGQLRRRPEIGIAQADQAALRQLAAELGLTPSARGRMGITPEKDEEEDPLERALRGDYR